MIKKNSQAALVSIFVLCELLFSVKNVQYAQYPQDKQSICLDVKGIGKKEKEREEKG